jgi:hypothetical protein
MSAWSSALQAGLRIALDRLRSPSDHPRSLLDHLRSSGLADTAGLGLGLHAAELLH